MNPRLENTVSLLFNQTFHAALETKARYTYTFIDYLNLNTFGIIFVLLPIPNEHLPQLYIKIQLLFFKFEGIVVNSYINDKKNILQ